MAEALEQGAEVFSPVMAEAITIVKRALGDLPVSRILDFGSGPGVATTALARSFPDAHIVAADGSAELLERVSARAADEGVADRVTIVCAELGAGVGDIEPVDLVWASMVIHHLDEPGEALAQLAQVTRPGGSIAMTEFGVPLTIFPSSDEAMSQLWERFSRASAGARGDHLPNSWIRDWPDRIHRAGFEIPSEHECVLEWPAPLSPSQREWLCHSVTRDTQMSADRLEKDDLADLEALADPTATGGIMSRQDLFIRTSRMLYLAVSAASGARR
jgi:SAM-dependent methyltransferase